MTLRNLVVWQADPELAWRELTDMPAVVHTQAVAGFGLSRRGARSDDDLLVLAQVEAPGVTCFLGWCHGHEFEGLAWPRKDRKGYAIAAMRLHRMADLLNLARRRGHRVEYPGECSGCRIGVVPEHFRWCGALSCEKR